jgi:hypothetical protein
MLVGAFTLGLRHYVFQAVCLRRRLFRGRPGHTEPGSPIVRWASPVKLWEDDKFFVKSFTATSYLPRLLVRSSSCSVLVLARWCLRVGACVSVLFLFGAGALADLKDSMNFWTLYVGLGFCRKLPYVSFREAVPHDIVHFFCT